MNLNQIFYTLEIYRSKSFTQAANNLFISQPSLSQQIKLLENELEVKLFYRNTRKQISLTPAGETFIKYAIDIEKKINSLNQSMEKYKQKNYLEIKIGLLWTFGYTNYLNDLLLDFQKMYPNLKIYYQFGASKKLLLDLHSKKLDLIFVTLDNVNLHKTRDFFKYELISHSPLRLLIHPTNPLNQKKILSIKDLDHINLMMVDKESFCYDSLFQSFLREQISPQIIGESSQADVIIQIVKNNIAAGFLAEETIHNYPAIQNIITKKIVPEYYRDIYLVYDQNNSQYPILHDFHEFITTSMKLHTSF